jgi:hypothetical protein
MPTDTPKTDAIVERADNLAFAREAWAVMCDHARQLERECASLRGRLSLAKIAAMADAQPWATDEPARVQLDRLTAKIEALTTALERMTENWIKECRRASVLKIALEDAISTYDPDREITIVTAERQEAWNEALKL